MWRRKLFGGREFESSLSKLISETGISRQEAEKILRQCNGDLKLAKQQAQAGVLGQTSRSIAGKNGELPSSSAGSYSDAPPPYSETVEGAMSLPVSLPPPYVSQEKQSLLGELKAVFSSDNVEERCCACFDRIQPDKDEGFSGEVIWQGLKAYHAECFLKARGPKCEHCCFALIAFPEKGLSGKWGIYNGCKYHEECYLQYAGPRCSTCFDVINVDPENGFSGKWVNESNKQFHEECYKKKLYVEMRAKHS
ncbi:uncharacterized protein LOC141879224 [Acropora palmata]|uniref:uncharacterized protein LOC141879224 n=1 Tax=Acropora palmata TaxID=6131 RepID=UPI003DA0CE13